jgi:Animal haem peroxidase
MPEKHGAKVQRGLTTTPQSPTTDGRFGRMFRTLLVFEPEDSLLKQLAGQMSESGTGSGGDNPNIPAGFTYFGQFVDHDITFDPVSSLQQQNDPEALRDFRTPRFDLDSLYGAGPADSPFLYDEDSGGTELLVGRNPKQDDDGEELERDDLPRNQQGTALIGDPRNDENIIVSQLHLSMIRFHTRVAKRVANREGLEGVELFKEAQRVVRWHYQWVVIHDFLERLVGANLVNQLLTPTQTPKVNLQFYKPKKNAFMPVEFSAAAYRFGHSMVRPTYKINKPVPELPIFSGKRKPAPREDFHGFRRLPSQWTLDWTFFFDVGGGRSRQQARKIDTKLAEGLHHLPGERGDMASLPLRNLRRGRALGLPSGQDVAEAMGATPLTKQQLGFDGPAPLWFYILREAELKQNGQRLGDVGATIVAEALLGLLDRDPLSYLSVKPTWTPDLPAKKQNDFTMADLLEFAVPDQTKR